MMFCKMIGNFNNKKKTPKTPPKPQRKPYRILLDEIAQHESRGSYNIIYGGKIKKLTSQTIDEIKGMQHRMIYEMGLPSSAVGRYQFIRKTFNRLINKLEIPGDVLFDEEMQDKLALELLYERGYDKFMKGKMSREQFMLNLSKEWASFPVPIDTKGAHRVVKAGETYYAGDKLNKALVSPTKVVAILQEMKALA